MTEYLFGDDLKKHLKDAEIGSKLMSKNYQGIKIRMCRKN